ncbi:serine hydrolase-like protein [Thrips palmi]|uniref:Serine hydrolase-like protein n=1 Tax=Thrips palmi TaxID=161013 RepID=A0A6P9ABY3_THRPL|nr:serine hydrolase-like protein [Thrips palmi]XP_034255656.1 serine hydrolase-like protein [Thrips palmi]
MESEQISTSAMTELTIQVPWGHISGKIWGSLDALPILCVHGIQDNASTFDNLIPMLPSSFCYVSIDLPGHGRSSHFPSGFMFSLVEYCMSLNRVVDHFNWKNFMYMGHSFGGQLGFLYAAFYPHRVTKLVVLDSVMPFRNADLDISEHIVPWWEKLYKIEAKMMSQSPPSYTEEEALRRLTDGRPIPLTREAAQVLLSRGVVRNGDGFSFSADQRLKLKVPMHFSKEEVLMLCSKIQCPLLLLRASVTEKAGAKYIFGDFEKLFEISLGDKYTYKVVRGTHDVHLLHPERLAEDVCNFFVKTKSSL